MTTTQNVRPGVAARTGDERVDEDQGQRNAGPLYPEHRRELLEQSAISPEIAAARGYRTISRPTRNDERPRQQLKRLGIPGWAIEEDRYFPGLLIPLYRPGGERISAQWKPRVAVRNRDGKPMKYAAAKGRSSVLDVHPVNRDTIADPAVPLWITEGVKKADALASQGLCVLALSGVFNWRSTMGTLGDWEDVPLRGRQVVICFDADAKTNPNVMRAMVRLGRWLKAKGVQETRYLIVPPLVSTRQVKGADDFLAAGGTLDQLRGAAVTKEPRPDGTSDTFSDARLAETIADDVLSERFCWAAGLGWMLWDGARWKACTDVTVGEAVRQYVLDRFGEVIAAQRAGDDQVGSAEAVDGWRAMLSAGRERSVIGLAKGIVERDAATFDRHPDLLNTPSGVVDLETGDLLPHDPSLLMTKMAGVPYRAGATHPDWDKALEALPAGVRPWMQVRMGQGITGHMTPDDVMIINHGGGENGKSTIHDTAARSIGDYFLLVSDRALMANPDAHPTELMDFMGARYAVLEETPEARRLDPQRLKRTVGTPRITARRIRQDSVTFDATHSLFLSTNHKPLVEESDHGTWRRLLLVSYPYRFRKAGEPIELKTDRPGDPGLRDRCKLDPEVQIAALAWLVDGARKWYAAGRVMPQPPESVVRDTRRWRADSDLILAYADDHLVIDRDWHVMSAELLEDFNEWVSARGHRQWSDRTLAARLEGHDELRAAGVEKRKIRARERLSRRSRGLFSGRPQTSPGFYAAWLGIRFAGASDAKIDDEPKPAPTSPDEDHVPGVPGRSDDAKNHAYKGSSQDAGTPGTDPGTPSTLFDPTCTPGDHPADPNYCPRCQQAYPNALAWSECDRCGTRTHSRGRGGHGATCSTCLTERNNA